MVDISTKTRVFPGFLIKTICVILFSSLLFSCRADNYKSEVTKKADSIISNFTKGDFSDIPGLNEYLSNLTNEQANGIIDTFQSIQEWEISSIKRVEENVDVTIELQIQDITKILNISFVQSEGEWIPKKDIYFSQTIDYVPLRGN